MTTIGNIFPDYPRVTGNESKAMVEQPPVDKPRDSVNIKWTWDPKLEHGDFIGMTIGFAGGICGSAGGGLLGSLTGGYLGGSISQVGAVIGALLGGGAGIVAGGATGIYAGLLVWKNMLLNSSKK